MFRFQYAIIVVTCFSFFIIGSMLKPYIDDSTMQDTVLNDVRMTSKDTPNLDPSTVMTPDQLNSAIQQVKTIQVLLWTAVHKWPKGLLHDFSHCRSPGGIRCVSTTDRGQYNVTQAVLFHGQALDPNAMPKYRFPHHKWIFYEIETPPQTWIQQVSLDPIRGVFNLTSTITMDSDIPILQHHHQCTVDKHRWKRNIEAKVNYAEGKGHRVAWFVSHCETQSQREQYVKALSEYVPVDIWGRCGNLKCGNKTHRAGCDEKVLNKDYKFYLSFENSICESYVTEKLWRLIAQPITAIPIVMGGVDYKSILPDRTYLDIKDFSSPRDLSKYLQKIDNDDNLFNEYINKKNALVCKYLGNKTMAEVRYPCQLCEYLHHHHDDVTQVPDILEFWHVDRRCTKAKDYNKGSFDQFAQ